MEKYKPHFSLASVLTTITFGAVTIEMFVLGQLLDGSITAKICVPIIVSSFGILAGFAVRQPISWFYGALGGLIFLSVFMLLLLPAT